MLMLYQPFSHLQVSEKAASFRQLVDQTSSSLGLGVFQGQTNQPVVDFVGKEVVEIKVKGCEGF